jgi:REP element-mobilizing transposase RayT
MHQKPIQGRLQTCPYAIYEHKTNDMTYNSDIHHRRSIRLKDYDYSQAGAYFVTICTWNKEYVFGEIDSGNMSLNAYGQVTTTCWRDLPKHYPHIELDEFVVMPNHTHGIIVINHVGAGFKPARLSKCIRNQYRAGYKPAPTQFTNTKQTT